ncbi:MAG: 4-hydroxy-3-methylbut-2-en-1-yl diphosphate synthase [Gammaproteobacteria bacterium]|nr:4-hydroxy-3-methylbut-2-en-1-yl diphosphate synthase [Gammaproteobacteria bacterium]
MKLENKPVQRRKTKKIWVGDVPVGGGSPVSVQSMTNTETTDVAATVKQVNELEDAGADIIRVSIPSMEAAESFKEIKSKTNIPLVSDIHFDYKIALQVLKYGVDCVRINPGNIGNERKIKEVISAARDMDVPIRIGVNAGSLEKDLQKKYGEPNADALVESAMRHVNILLDNNYENFKLSIKSSDIYMAVESYEKISDLIDQPLHLGITESGSLKTGTVKSSIGLGSLLMQGIGDTVRVSLASDPVDEVHVAWEMLKSLKIRSRGVKIVACPSCSRQNFKVINTVNRLENELSYLKEEVTLAVIGCYVNGPGESKVADVGVTGASPKHLIYLNGKPAYKVETSELENALIKEVTKIADQKRNTILKG